MGFLSGSLGNFEEIPEGLEYLDGLSGEDAIEAIRRHHDNINVITKMIIFVK